MLNQFRAGVGSTETRPGRSWLSGVSATLLSLQAGCRHATSGCSRGATPRRVGDPSRRQALRGGEGTPALRAGASRVSAFAAHPPFLT